MCAYCCVCVCTYLYGLNTLLYFLIRLRTCLHGMCTFLFVCKLFVSCVYVCVRVCMVLFCFVYVVVLMCACLYLFLFLFGFERVVCVLSGLYMILYVHELCCCFVCDVCMSVYGVCTLLYMCCVVVYCVCALL